MVRARLRKACLLAAAAGVLLSSGATHAQAVVSETAWTSGSVASDNPSQTTLPVEFIKPTGNDKRLDCTPQLSDDVDTTCQPLNIAGCNASLSRDIELRIDLSQLNLASTSKIWGWWQKGTSCSDEQKLTEPVLDEQSIAANLQWFTFPNDAALDNLEFNTDDIFARAEAVAGSGTPACSGENNETAGLDQNNLRLCFGVNDPALSEPSKAHIFGWAQFAVDTVSPKTPTIDKVTPLDGQIELALSSTDSDVKQWEARIRSLEDLEKDKEIDSRVDADDCSTWWAYAGDRSSLSSDELKETALTLSGENGITYKICAQVRDELNNASAYSLVAEGTPRDACDFIECYPGELKTGHYCGAVGIGPICAALLGLWLAIRGCRGQNHRRQS